MTPTSLAALDFDWARAGAPVSVPATTASTTTIPTVHDLDMTLPPSTTVCGRDHDTFGSRAGRALPHARSPFRRASLPPVPNRTRAFAAVGAGLLLLALNVLDAADRGASAGNIVAIACGAFLLFWGFAMVARTGPPPSP